MRCCECCTAGAMKRRRATRSRAFAFAYEAGRDGFWLARWLRARDVECDVIHPTSVSVSREHRRAKTDRLDLGLLKRAYLGWLRGEKRHCSMVAVPSRETEDGKRPLRERDCLVADATRLVNRVKGCWRCPASPNSMSARRRRRSACRCCARRRTSRCHPTRWPSCCAGSNGCSRSRRRSRRSKRPSGSGSSRPPTPGRTR